MSMVGESGAAGANLVQTDETVLSAKYSDEDLEAAAGEFPAYGSDNIFLQTAPVVCC